MHTIWGNLGRLFLLILLLPLFIILIGPFLVLAALRGRQPIGPITLDTVRYGLAGRLGGFILGLVAWMLVWGGLVWLALNSYPSTPTVAEVLSTTSPTPVQPNDTATPTSPPPTFTPTASPTATIPTTPTPVITLTLTAIFDLTPTATETTTPSPTLSTTPTLTATLTTTATFTPTPTQEITATETIVTPAVESGPPIVDLVETVRPTPLPPLSPEDQQAIFATLQEGNNLLRTATMMADEVNLQNLEQLWRGQALDNAANFATENYNLYSQPFEITFEYITPPQISDRSSPDQVIVNSQERWAYRGNTTQEETLEFIYTLSREADGWVITNYTYRNLSTE